MMPKFLACLFVVALFHEGEAFETGAPLSTCFTLHPKHSHTATQTTVCPFVFKFTPNQFKPGDEVTIDIADPNGRTFRGIELGARRNDNPEVFVGQFVDFPSNKIKVFNCFGGFHNMITQMNKNGVTSLTVKWKAPSQYVGDVKFRGTVVVDFTTFWVNVEHVLKAASSVLTPVPPPYPPVVTNALVTDVDFSTCGDQKGCFFYPRYCGGSDCVAAATFQYRSSSDDYVVELFTSEGPNYISFGLSHDDIMGDDATFTCTNRPGFMSVQTGWNPAQHNERQLTRNISALEVRQKDGDTVCRFVIPSSVQVYHMSQNAFNYTLQTYDTDEKWYLQLAWGKTMPESDVIAFHLEMPAVSYSKADLKSSRIVYGSAYHIMVRVHVAMMVIAWVLFTGIVTVISRHYKDWLPQRRLFGTKVWFQVHRELAVMVAVFNAIGLIVIFTHYGSEIRETAIPHAYVGLTVTACVGLQIIAGILRPGGDHKIRPIFNWAHRFLGQASHILAAATMFLGYDIEYITPSMRKFGFITLSVWVAGQVLWHIIFEVISCRNNKSEKPTSYDMGGDETEMQRRKPSKFETFMLCLYIASLVILCIAIMTSFLLF